MEQSVKLLSRTFMTNHWMVWKPEWYQYLCARLQYLQCISNGDIKNNAWVTMNNDFWVMSKAICQRFQRLPKSLANRITSDQKSLLTLTNVLFYFLHVMLCPEHTVQLKTKKKYRSLILPLSLRMVFSNIILWRHHSWFVMSCEHRVMALWRHIHWLFLHAQISAKVIFTSE